MTLSYGEGRLGNELLQYLDFAALARPPHRAGVGLAQCIPVVVGRLGRQATSLEVPAPSSGDSR
jgi:hypothetical protein